MVVIMENSGDSHYFEMKEKLQSFLLPQIRLVSEDLSTIILFS